VAAANSNARASAADAGITSADAMLAVDRRWPAVGSRSALREPGSTLHISARGKLGQAAAAMSIGAAAVATIEHGTPQDPTDESRRRAAPRPRHGVPAPDR
jgi:hypothetical protein